MNSVHIAVDGVEPETELAHLDRFCRHALAAVGVENWELSLLICDDACIRNLNVRYRGVDAPTDILSFPLLEQSDELPAGAFPQMMPHSIAGDIVISLESAMRAIHRPENSEEEELQRLIVHGILHLQGYDHGDYAPDLSDRAALPPMLLLQEEIVQRLRSRHAGDIQ